MVYLYILLFLFFVLGLIKPDLYLKDTPKPRVKIATAYLSIMVFFAMFSNPGDSTSTNNSGMSTPVEAASISPESERRQKVEAQFSGWDGSHRGLTRLLKDNMNDPDSYEHVETRFKDEGDLIFVQTKFRGKNAFGGKVVNMVTARVDLNGNVVEIIDQE